MEHKRKITIPIQYKGPDFKNIWTLLMIAAIAILIMVLAWTPVKTWLNPPIAFTDDAGNFLFARQVPGSNQVLALGFEEGGRVRWNRFTIQSRQPAPDPIPKPTAKDSLDAVLEDAIKEAQEVLDAGKVLDTLEQDADVLGKKVKDFGKKVRQKTG